MQDKKIQEYSIPTSFDKQKASRSLEKKQTRTESKLQNQTNRSKLKHKPGENPKTANKVKNEKYQEGPGGNMNEPANKRGKIRRYLFI